MGQGCGAPLPIYSKPLQRAYMSNQSELEGIQSEFALTETQEEQSTPEFTFEASTVPMSKKQHKMYFGQLRLLSRIHAEIKDKINAKRQANYEAFFAETDKYIPETNESSNFLALHFTTKL